ncbi:sugar phosphate nucleotidyltransferase [Lachnospiraceae bacterium 62-35]
MGRELEQYLLRSDMTVCEAMRIIDKNGQKAAFLVTDGKLAGSLTDGDIRRHLLQGGSINDLVVNIVNCNPQYVYKDDEPIDYKQYMMKRFLNALPVVDRDNVLVRVETLNSTGKILHTINANVPLIIMAGGLGSRLKPYTDIIPKPLIPIGDKTITEHILERFESYGCKQSYMIVNYKKKLIETYFNDSEQYQEIHFVEEPFFMGTAGGIKLLQKELRDNFFLVNCDILIDSDYYQIWEEHVNKNNLITMVCAKIHMSIPYGTVKADKEDQVVSLEEKPRWHYNVNTGMYICNARIFDYMKEEKIDMPDLIRRCIEAGERVGQFQIDESEWYDMGQPNQLEKMKQRLGII